LLRTAIGREVEVEFAVNLELTGKPVLHLLQVRPMAVKQFSLDISADEKKRENIICKSTHVMGNGIMDAIRDVIFVDGRTFDRSKTVEIAAEIGELNAILRGQNRNYLLIGFGRWGTLDPWLGIPVNWDQISHVRAIIEADREDFYVDPSLGTHFFQNVTARELGFFSVSVRDERHFVDWQFLQNQPVANRRDHTSHIHFEQPLVIKINGKTQEGVILKPRG
jgi:hypothetical protein